MLRQKSGARALVPLVLALLGLLLAAGPGTATAGQGVKAGHEAHARSNSNRLIAPDSVCPDVPDHRLNRARKAMMCMTNFARRQLGLRKYHHSRRLKRSARMKARDILRCDSFSHSACGRDFTFWFSREGYLGKVCRVISENIAWGEGSLANTHSIFEAWMNSPPHREAILSRHYKVFGVGVVRGKMKSSRGAGVWVQHFGAGC